MSYARTCPSCGESFTAARVNRRGALIAAGWSASELLPADRSP